MPITVCNNKVTGELNVVADTTIDCEQVTIDFNDPRVHQGQWQDVATEVYNVCTEVAKHKVEWGEKDMHPGEMFMCDHHMSEFLQDAEWCEGITWTFVQSLTIED